MGLVAVWVACPWLRKRRCRIEKAGEARKQARSDIWEKESGSTIRREHTLSFDRLHDTPTSVCQPADGMSQSSCRASCIELLRNHRNAEQEAPEMPSQGYKSGRRDLHALGAYFWRTFLRLGDDDLLSTSICSIGEGWLFMTRRSCWKKDGARPSYFGTRPGSGH